LNAPQPAWKWPGILAKNNILTDPTFYFAKNDPAFNANTQLRFIITPNAARNQMHTDFTGGGRSPSWSFVGGVKMSDKPTTPVIFTRGLVANTGLWNQTSGVYGSTGGYIAFLGGNVAFYPSIQNTAQNPSPFESNNPTSTSQTRPINILQAIPFNTSATTTSARIYSINPPAGAGGMVGNAAGQLAARGP
jgi:hypothetical protein